MTKARVRTAVWFAIGPVVVLGLLPWWLHGRFEGPTGWEGSLWPWVGLGLLLTGVGLAARCVNLFNVLGLGTPLLWDPPRHLVSQGPYRVVRNPMMLGVFLILAGEALLYQSWLTAGYLTVIIGLAHAFVCRIEEPDLERRFGPSYASYKQRVPRWIPARLNSPHPQKGA